MNTEQIHDLVERYYALFDSRTGDVSTLGSLVAPGWRNVGSPGAELDVDAFSGLLTGLTQIVPDLTWTISETIIAGDRVIVRGEGSGTPVAQLFGAPATGRPFRIISIDIHTIADGRILSSVHLEDWAGALAQINA